ncbi:hypothetical protein A9G25_04700 [Gilliamella sp. Bif1-4]|nr:hypothetical protein A9G25_04700 [Gilliamella apicola]
MTWVDPWGLICHKHHSDPKFAGGKSKQPLTIIDEDIHRQLHKEMNAFLVKKTKKLNDERIVHMRPQRGNSGGKILENFGRKKVLNALAEFYKGPGAKYTEVAEDFFKQHPELK